MEIRILGEIGIHGPEGQIRLERMAERGVLAALALCPGEWVNAHTLAEHIWPAGPPPSAAASLGKYVERVRTAIQTAGGDKNWLRTRGVGSAHTDRARAYRLDVDPLLVDHHRSAHHAKLARTAAGRGEHEKAIAEYQAALGLWRGEPLSPVTGTWVEGQRFMLAQERLRMHTELLAEQLHAGDFPTVASNVTRLLNECTPTDELIMIGLRALAWCGRHTAIREFLDFATQRMRAACAAEPGPGVRELARHLLANPPRIAEPVPAPPESFAEATAVVAALPPDVLSFTGRTRELRELTQAVLRAAEGGTRIIAVDGMPGVGKTTLAVHAAHQLASRFPDGQFFLQLNAFTLGQRPLDPADGLIDLLVAIGVPARGIPSSCQARATLWRRRTHGKRLLLLLDDAAGHEQIWPLLPGSPGCFVLITSRRRLGALEHLRSLELAKMPPADAAELFLTLAGEQHRTAATDVADLVARCDFLPLAIRLAAGRLRHHPRWSVRHLVDLLACKQHRLSEIRAEKLCITAAFELSYQGLSEDQQRLFQQLGEHPGTEIDAYGAAALAGTDLATAGQGLEDLYDDHLLTETAPGRYGLHDLLQEYARMLSPPDRRQQRREALGRLLSYYLHTTIAATAQILVAAPVTEAAEPEHPPAHRPTITGANALAWLDSERCNLAACVLTPVPPEHAGLITALATALHPYLRRRGNWQQSSVLNQTALAVARRTGDRRGEANALSILGNVARLDGDNLAATGHLTQALALYRELDDLAGQAGTLNELGVVQYLVCDLAAATTNLYEAAEHYRTVGNTLGQAHALNDLGWTRFLDGDNCCAGGNLADALTFYRRLGNILGQANTLRDAALMRALSGDHTGARFDIAEALTYYRALGDELGEAGALNHSCLVRINTGELTEAAKDVTRSLAQSRALGDVLGQANALNSMGYLHSLTGDRAGAARDLTAALALYRHMRNPLGAAVTLWRLAAVRLAQDRVEEARSLYSRSLELGQQMAAPSVLAEAGAGLGRCLVRLHKVEEGREHLRRALSIYALIRWPQARRVAAELAELDRILPS
ncbi:AfsR/SARP family transcriptional regulator [Crossiella cryophila]|uniref:DNA-binding SARP family transcriptional activator/tetratricopeptide (TPR) repeat protein n=1 Tax=Crossiella cryophila TaxID=43355 RepID=A0A7W7FW19_9PSEU|nr:tetratricopeptide repeat protein [Crossiella cryophila]MBB4679822.1 DNA-binding SARP family transcriptional activator/tetratricopeptide (TPR) repeat protein [Crossiella cryophila]